MPNIRLQNISFRYNAQKQILSNATAHITDGWTALVGENGCGKSTLLKLLLSKLKELNSKELGRVMSIFAALGCSPQVVENGVSMSPGEMRKLSLALGMGNFVWALLLDEPTNHLDLQSIERLEEALKAFPGALVLISHDSVFAERCTERVVDVFAEDLIE